LWEPELRDGARPDSGLFAHLPDKVRGFLSANTQREAGPNYLDVVSVSIDIMSDFLRQTRHAIDPPDVLLDADLSDILSLELYRAGEAIDEGRRVVTAATAAIQALVPDRGKDTAASRSRS
jgi:NTE family protein